MSGKAKSIEERAENVGGRSFKKKESNLKIL